MAPSEIKQLTPEGYGGDFEMTMEVGEWVESMIGTDIISYEKNHHFHISGGLAY